ncbi:MAG TPA: nuclear transport factor 2 family protein [Ktedonobacteraceae bacterium]|nr:nuclear transport factor 2 family protein [Ktedonobacteraceae bacterium]
MNGAETVKDFILALESQEYSKAAGYLAGDFTYTGLVPRPLNKKQFITLIEELKYGMPNLSFNVHDIQQAEVIVQGQMIQATIQMTGTQSNIMNLVPLSLPPIPETNRRVTLPEEHLTFLVENNQIQSITVQPVAGGGIPGVLHQLGIDAPIIQ